MNQMTEELLFDHVPSRRKPILDQMLGQTIKGITKKMNTSFKAYAEEIHPNLKLDQYFSESNGEVELSFENDLRVGFSFTEYLSSVLVYMIQNADKTLVLNTKALQKRMNDFGIPDDIVIKASDDVYSDGKFTKFIGKKISSIGVIKPKEELFHPEERGIVFHFDDCEELIFAFFLGYMSGGVSILTKDKLNPERLVGMKEFNYHENKKGSGLLKWRPSILDTSTV